MLSGGPSCDVGELCCSTDPAALDLMNLDAFVVPAYQGKNPNGGMPLFADANNEVSQRGACVPEGQVSEALGLVGAPGCPIPCNPTWSSSDINAICGNGAICCQPSGTRAAGGR